jgi:Tfp pilus assembly protein PilO
MSDTKTITWRERMASPLTWHVAGAGILLIVMVVLATRFGLDWAAVSSNSSDALSSKQVELKALDMQTAPLRGLDKRVVESRQKIKEFYADRIPANYSSFATRIGELQVKSGVRLSRLQYGQGKPGPELTEIFLDASITGDYPEIMHFVNSLERDKTFFVVRQMALTGQQGGVVNLRLEVSTWLQNAAAAASGLPRQNTTTQPGAARPAATAPEGE